MIYYDFYNQLMNLEIVLKYHLVISKTKNNIKTLKR